MRLKKNQEEKTLN